MSPRARRARREQARTAGRRGEPAPAAGLEAWVANSSGVLAGALLIFALGLRAYYFALTKDQPLWWDEAEYMLKAKAMALGTPDTGWWTARPVLLSLLAAAVFKVGLGETAIRLLWVVLSTATLALVYGLGTRLFNARVGICALALATVSYIDVFYTMRLLVDGPPQVFFGTLAIFLMVWGIATPRRWAIWAVFPALALGVGLRFTAAILIPVVVAFLLATRGLKVLKERAWHVSVGLAALMALAMLLYFWRQYGDPIAPFFSHMVLRGGLSSGGGILSLPTEIAMQYVRYFPEYTTPLVTVAFAAGLVQAIVVLARGFGRRRDDRAVQGSLLVLLWIVVPFLFYGFAVNTFQDRFLTVIFSAVFIVIGVALDGLFTLMRPWSPALAAVVVAAIVLYGGGEMTRRTDAIVRGKIPSYQGVAEAGRWIRTHGRPGVAVLSSSVPQITYYAERPTFTLPAEERQLDEVLAARAPGYLVISAWEPSPAWVYEWPRRNPDKVSVAATFHADAERTQLSAVVYAFRAPAGRPR